MLLTIILLGACTASPSTTISTAVPTVSAIVTPQLLPELAAPAEAWHLLSSQGNQVWPEWGTSRIPLLIRAGEFDLLAGHRSPPQGFSLLPGATLADQPVYRYAGHLVPIPAATTWEVGGVWSVAVPTREEFQQAIDAQLGKGVVQLDAVNYIRTIVHEAFHAYAMTIIRGQVPNFGADVDEAEMIQRLSALPDQNKQHAAEGQALVKALQAIDDQAVREAVTEFLTLRQARRAVGGKHIAAYEQTTEWLEGLARYADVSVMQRAGQATYTPLDKAIKYPAADEIWRQFLDLLANPAASPDGFRGRYYLLGAGQAFLLDRLMPNWKTQVFSEKQSLEDLLEQATR